MVYIVISTSKKKKIAWSTRRKHLPLSLSGSGGWLESNSYNQNATIIAMQTQ